MLFEDRERAESFGAIAERYDRARPSYPPGLIDFLVAGGCPRVLDVGCGTGIAAVLFAARGCAVVGVEVDERMAELARAKGLDVEIARFEEWDPAGRSFDLVTAAQSWHWVSPRAGAAKAAAVLRPGGRLALFWNVGHPPPQVRARLTAIYERLEPGIARNSVVLGLAASRAVTDRHASSIVESPDFGPGASDVFPWSITYDTASWIERLSTSSEYNVLATERRERLFAAVGEAIDQLGGSFEMRYDAVLVTATRR